MTAFEIILTVIGALLLIGFLFIIPYITYRIAFMRKPWRENRSFSGNEELDAFLAEKKAEFLKIPAEVVEITSRDGLKLRARLYLKDTSRPFEIQFHGYRSCPLRDFSGAGVDVINRGDNLLLVYQRSHGESEGRAISFGIKERYDVPSWINYLLDRFGSDIKICLTGISMGASTVLMASRLNLPENVKYIVADCGYSNAGEIIRRVAGKMGFPPKLAYPFVKLGALIYAGFNPDADSPEEAVKEAKIPILILHGEEDGFVPCEMGEKIYKNCKSPCRLVTFPGANHGMSAVVDKPRYMAEIKAYHDRYFGEEIEN